MVLRFNFGTLARPFACDYLGFKTAVKQKHHAMAPFLHPHHSLPQLKPRDPGSPLSYQCQLSPEHASSCTDKGEKCASTGTANHRYIWAEKEEESTSLCLTFLVSDQTGFPWGHISWWLLSNPSLHMPLQNASSSAPTLLAVWPNPTRLKLFMAVPKLCLVQTVSVKFCLCLFVQISRSYFPIPAPPLLHPTVNCTMIFSLLHNENQPPPGFLSHFSIYDSRPLASKPSQLTSSILPSPSASSFSHTLLRWPSANFFPLTPCSNLRLPFIPAVISSIFKRDFIYL